MADNSFPNDSNLVSGGESHGSTLQNGATDAAAKRKPSEFVRDEASKLAGQAGEKARSLADTSKDRATGALSDFSNLMRDAAVTVDDKIGPQYGQYARSAADQISGLAESLRGKQVDDLIEDARGFIRKSPAVAVGIAAGVGFIAARLLKSGIEASGDKTGNGTGDKSTKG